MKRMYEKPKMEIILFTQRDFVVASDGDNDEKDGGWVTTSAAADY